MSKQSTTLTAAIVVAVVVGFTVSFTLASALQKPTARQVVKNVCDYSRTVNNASWRQACGNAQDGANSEYLCNGVDANAKCWVEVK
jgi:hypothetical protein